MNPRKRAASFLGLWFATAMITAATACLNATTMDRGPAPHLQARFTDPTEAHRTFRYEAYIKNRVQEIDIRIEGIYETPNRFACVITDVPETLEDFFVNSIHVTSVGEEAWIGSNRYQKSQTIPQVRSGFYGPAPRRHISLDDPELPARHRSIVEMCRQAPGIWNIRTNQELWRAASRDTDTAGQDNVLESAELTLRDRNAEKFLAYLGINAAPNQGSQATETWMRINDTNSILILVEPPEKEKTE